MVRYARSKGSKASNERRVEEATPWREMRNQMIAAQNKVFQKVDDSVDFKEKQSERKISTVWAPIDVPESESIKKFKKHSIIGVKPKKIKFIQNKVIDEVEYFACDDPHEREVSTSMDAINNLDTTRIKKSKKHLFPKEDEFVERKKKKLHKTKTYNALKRDIASSKIPREENIMCEVETETSPGTEKVEHNCRTKPYQSSEKKLSTYSGSGEIHSLENFQSGNNSKNNMLNKISKFEQEYNKLVLEETSKQKKRHVPTKEFIGGREVEIYYFDGFPVMKEDKERLVELKEEMMKKEIPEDEMKAALKLERRRAEKALARQRKKVCFHCRESGQLSECPSLNGCDPLSRKKGSISETGNAEVCFKCGSTEHTYLKCKLGERDNFKFASCFICGEQGHISKQCPENPRGVYPKGGACRTCGDVTHLRRDCPKYQEEQQRDVTTLPTLKGEGALEDLEVDHQKEKKLKTYKPVKKVVKF